MKCSFFLAAVVLILLYGWTMWTVNNRMEKKIDGNYARMLQAILNKSWRQHPAIQKLYGHQPPITKTIKIRPTRHAGHCWRSRDEFISYVLLWILHMDMQRYDDQLEPTHSSSLLIRDVNPESLPVIMNNRDRWQGRVKNIRDMMLMMTEAFRLQWKTTS